MSRRRETSAHTQGFPQKTSPGAYRQQNKTKLSILCLFFFSPQGIITPFSVNIGPASRLPLSLLLGAA